MEVSTMNENYERDDYQYSERDLNDTEIRIDDEPE